MNALYNDIEPYANKLLSMRIKDGWLPQGEVTDDDIRTLSRKDLSKFNHIHLFAGIGGFPLAARFAGVPDDFKLFTAGFPCQPFSNAGTRSGAEDDRYLWPETLCALKSHRPDVAILENVAGLISMAFQISPTLMDLQTLTAGLRDYHYLEEALAVVEQIAVDVEEAGYTVQALIIPACAVDAKHRRDRIWFICIKNSLAHTDRTRQSQQTRVECKSGLGTIKRCEDVADIKSRRRRELGHGHKTQGHNGSEKSQSIGGGAARKENVSDSAGGRRKEQRKYVESLRSTPRETWQTTQFINGGERCEWVPEPAVGRVVNGLPGRVDRIKGLGNAIVPQVAAEIMRFVMISLGLQSEVA